MTNRYVLTAACALALAGCSSEKTQEASDLTKHELSGPVKYEKVDVYSGEFVDGVAVKGVKKHEFAYEYDQDGFMTVMLTYDFKTGEVVSKVVKEHDEQHRLVHQKNYDEKDNLLGSQEFSYGPDGIPTQTVSYDANGNEEVKYLYTKDKENPNRVTANLYRPGNNVSVTYCIEEYEGGQIKSRFLNKGACTNFENGVVVKQQDGVSQAVPTRNEKGWITSIANGYSWNITSECINVINGFNTQYSFETDDKGNWIRRVCFDEEGVINIIERELLYY